MLHLPLYGSKAANGVVIITTKKTSAEDKFTVNMSSGLNTRAIPEYERVDAFQYYPLRSDETVDQWAHLLC
jgi:outer membrane receptor for ferrienterochelin and colicin